MKLKLLNSSMLLATLALSACGPQAFVPDTVVSNQSAAGGMNLPPKVDIVLGISQGGTMQNIYSGLSPELVQFTNNLQKQGWDYRFVAIPLSESRPGASHPISAGVTPSIYHTNFSQAQWLPPYPGAQYLDNLSNPNPLFLLSPSLFSSAFVIPSMDYSTNNGRETGLKNQADFLNRSDVRNNFLRSDALLAVITISNGRDTSDGWQYAGWGPPENQVPKAVNVTNYVNQMKAAKTNPSMAKYYALVAHGQNNCRGPYQSWSGIDYDKAAQQMGGVGLYSSPNYTSPTDICTHSTSAALAEVSNHLDKVQLDFQKKYLVIGTEPNVGTIKVFKNGILLAQNASNGWTYEGYKTNVNTIDLPVPMAAATGYFIELHGSAKLFGKDTARVEYMNAGSVTAH